MQLGVDSNKVMTGEHSRGCPPRVEVTYSSGVVSSAVAATSWVSHVADGALGRRAPVCQTEGLEATERIHSHQPP